MIDRTLGTAILPRILRRLTAISAFLAAAAKCVAADSSILILSFDEVVEVASANNPNSFTSVTNRQRIRGDQILRVGNHGRALVKMGEAKILEFGPGSIIGAAETELTVWQGIVHFFSRTSTPWRFKTPTSSGVVRGTEAVIRVPTDRTRTEIDLIEGRVEIAFHQQPIVLRAKESAVIFGNAPVTVAAGLDVIKSIQWVVYYPVFLHIDELDLSPATQARISESLNAFALGDLKGAINLLPPVNAGLPSEERLYIAAVYLSNGHVVRCEEILAQLESENLPQQLLSIVASIRVFVATVQGRAVDRPLSKAPPVSEEIVYSYVEQAKGDIPAALSLARNAAKRAPRFSYASLRIAELELASGYLRSAKTGIEAALAELPRHAYAWALNGFARAAAEKPLLALESFNQAIELDCGLGDAWLGRGLVKIRLGEEEEGFTDLLVAAATEPNRGSIRSYLGKAWSVNDDFDRAKEELSIAKRIDPADPTPWLYSALLAQDQNRLNAGIRDFETSKELNQNRRVFRSSYLLDEDRAVRGAGLASLYADNQMADVAIHEAALAVSYDQSSYAAHRFLAGAYDALRDPTRFNLQYETVWFNQYLLANILSPVGAEGLSHRTTQSEFSRLFEKNRLGLSSDVEVFSNGEIRERASQFGRYDRLGWSFDLDYQYRDDAYYDAMLSRIEWYTQLKYQLTPQDSVLLLSKYQDMESGDNRQVFDPANRIRDLEIEERDEPLALIALHREWTPENRTIALIGGLRADQRVTTATFPTRELFQGVLTNFFTDEGYRPLEHTTEFRAGIAELNHMLSTERNSFNFGGRYQVGYLRASDSFDHDASFSPGTIDEDFERRSAYAYWTLRPLLDRRLSLVTGLTYDDLTFPKNFRLPPIGVGTQHASAFSPKVGLIWEVTPDWALRAVYAHALGGVTFDDTFRLEPAQIAGFPTAYRSVISESIVGSVSAPRHEVAAVAYDGKLGAATYLGATVHVIESDVDQEIGVIGTNPPESRLSTDERLQFRSKGFVAYLHQLVSQEWSMGFRYSFTDAELLFDYPDLPPLDHGPAKIEQAKLNEFRWYGVFRHPRGYFASGNFTLYHQSGYLDSRIEDTTRQFDLSVGYRFSRPRLDVSFTIYNILDENYRLYSLTPFPGIHRERTISTRMRIRF